MLALAIGLPLLGLFMLRSILTLTQLARITELTGQQWTARNYLLGFLISPVVVPSVWCAAALYGALLNAPRSLRRTAAGLLFLVIAWALAVAVRIATL